MPEGVVTVDGELHEFDVLDLRHRLPAVEVPHADEGRRPRRRRTSTSRWDGDARAYLGITVPGFPNFFMLYGPNTNIVVNGSIIWFSECEVRYVMDCIRAMLAEGATALDVQAATCTTLQRRRSTPRTCAWRGACRRSTAGTRTPSGRVAQNWPFPLLEYWKRTRAVDAADYEPV